jgi:hypothetical protein
MKATRAKKVLPVFIEDEHFIKADNAVLAKMLQVGATLEERVRDFAFNGAGPGVLDSRG